MQYVNVVTHYTNKGSLRTAQVGNILPCLIILSFSKSKDTFLSKPCNSILSKVSIDSVIVYK